MTDETTKTVESTDVYKNDEVVKDMCDRFTAVAGDEYTDEDREAVVEVLADELGKSKRSVIQKLVREGVYRAKQYKTKTGKAIVNKGMLVDDLISALGVEFTESEASSLEKPTKRALEKVLAAVNAMHDEIDLVDVELEEVA